MKARRVICSQTKPQRPKTARTERAALLPRLASLALAAALASTAAAQEADAAPDGTPPAPEQITAIAQADWNGDGELDMAVLLPRPENADLLIYLSVDGDPAGPRLALRAERLVWRGALFGAQPSLEVGEDGRLRIVSGNNAVGRERWIQTLTVAYEDEAFVLAHFAYRAFDTLDPSATTECQVDFTSQLGERDGRAFAIDIPPTPIEAWSFEHVIPSCTD